MWECLKLTKERLVYVRNIYCPPDASVQNSLYDLEQHRSSLDIPANADVLYLGDVNIDFAVNSADKRRLISFLRLYNMEQLITNFTRVTPNFNRPYLV